MILKADGRVVDGNDAINDVRKRLKPDIAVKSNGTPPPTPQRDSFTIRTYQDLDEFSDLLFDGYYADVSVLRLYCEGY